MEKVSNQNKSDDDSTVNNPVAANESSNLIRPVAGITVTTNAAISTDAGTEELEKVSNKNICKDDSTVNNPVAANRARMSYALPLISRLLQMLRDRLTPPPRHPPPC